MWGGKGEMQGGLRGCVVPLWHQKRSRTVSCCALFLTRRSSSRRRTDRFLPPAGWRHIVSDLHNVFIFSAWGDALSSHFPDWPCVSDETCSTLCLLLKQESRWWGHTGQHCVQNLPVQDVRWGGLGCRFTAPTPRMMNSATIYRKLATYFSNLWLTDDVKKTCKLNPWCVLVAPHSHRPTSDWATLWQYFLCNHEFFCNVTNQVNKIATETMVGLLFVIRLELCSLEFRNPQTSLWWEFSEPSWKLSD